jgi:hypothetical protein
MEVGKAIDVIMEREFTLVMNLHQFGDPAFFGS